MIKDNLLLNYNQMEYHSMINFNIVIKLNLKNHVIILFFSFSKSSYIRTKILIIYIIELL